MGNGRVYFVGQIHGIFFLTSPGSSELDLGTVHEAFILILSFLFSSFFVYTFLPSTHTTLSIDNVFKGRGAREQFTALNRLG